MPNHIKSGESKKDLITIRLRAYAPDGRIQLGTLTAVGKETGATREYVRQVAQAQGYLRAHLVAKESRRKDCEYCKKSFFRKHKNVKYCTLECREKVSRYTHYTLDICEECGFAFLNPTNRGDRHKRFCSKTCFGKSHARKYGWGTRLNRGGTKSPSISIMKKDFPSGFTAEEFGKKYTYASYNSAYTRIQTLVYQGLVERYPAVGNQYFYRVKSKTPLVKKQRV